VWGCHQNRSPLFVLIRVPQSARQKGSWETEKVYSEQVLKLMDGGEGCIQGYNVANADEALGRER